MSSTEVKSFCRICIGACGTVLTLDENGRITAIRRDKEHPASGGYVCVKGLMAPAALAISQFRHKTSAFGWGRRPFSLTWAEVRGSMPFRWPGSWPTRSCSLPDQRKVARALSSLELLVTIDPIMSNTAKLSHYILPPRLQDERADLPTTRDYETLFFHVPFWQYTPGVAQPVVDDWYVFWALAKRLGRTIVYDGVPLDMTNVPTSEDLIAIVTRNSQVPLEKIRKYPGGRIFDVAPQYVEPADDSRGKFAVIPSDVAQELAAVAQEFDASAINPSAGQSFSHRLSVRRMREESNTMYQELPEIRRRRPYNPAWMYRARVIETGCGLIRVK